MQITSEEESATDEAGRKKMVISQCRDLGITATWDQIILCYGELFCILQDISSVSGLSPVDASSTPQL